MSMSATDDALRTHPHSDSLTRARAGMGWFLASEAAFFVFLIYSFVAARSASSAQPGAGSVLDARMAGIMTLILLSSSATLWVARRVMQSRPAVTAGAMLATVSLGATFLALQLSEYRSLLGQDLTISTSPFGSHFFILTGFHGIHVAIGVILLSVSLLLGFSARRRPAANRLLATGELYWHFVDAVWILIFAIVYLRVGAA